MNPSQASTPRPAPAPTRSAASPTVRSAASPTVRSAASSTVYPTVALPQPNTAATVTAAAAANQSVPRMTLDEAKKRYDAGQTMIVDVRAQEIYAAGHIKGAANVPETETAARLAELPKDNDILLYCA
jgi:3-mercaptopyruvate sulfurtransferase SseA